MKTETNWQDLLDSILLLAAIAVALIFALVSLPGCSPRIIERVETRIEYRDRYIHDTATVEIIREVERIVTRDTASHLENTYAKSDAVVSGTFLHHSLESIPQFIKVPVEVHVTDTLYKEAQIIEKEVEVEKPLNWAQQTKIGAFWWLVAGLLASLLWIFRKVIF